MLTVHIILYIGCQVITCHTNRVVRNDASQRDNSYLSATATDINNHVSFRCFDINTYTYGSRHGFKNQINIASVGMLSRVANGPKLNFGASRRHSDNHSKRRREDATPCMNLLNKAAHHLFASCKVCNNTITQRPNGTNILVCFLIHQLRLFPNGYHLVCASVKRNHRWLVDHNFIVTDNNSVGSAKVHCNALH